LILSIHIAENAVTMMITVFAPL